MKLPKAGWILTRSDKHPVLFTPLKDDKNRNLISPNPIKVQIGASLSTRLKPKNLHKLSPFHLPIRLHQEASGQIRVGPLIGILTSDGHRSFRGNHENFADLIRMGRKMGVSVFVLTPRSFQNQNHWVQGFLLDPRSKKNRWLQAKLPFPNVIYNRIPNRVVEKRSEEKAILQRLNQHPHVHLFNAGFFNKWHLYQLLHKSEEWRFMIPPTKPLNHIQPLQTMLKQHPILYAKPINGKAGIGLMKITKHHDQYLLIYQGSQGRKRYKRNNMEQLWTLIQEKKQNQDYVLQRGIPLAKYQNRPCDFRVLIQKDDRGIWQVTGMGVRVAGNHAISTHVPMGGTIANVHQVLKALFPDNHTYVSQKLSQKTKGIAEYIENSYATQLGEMSMDIGIEPNGRMWFFEANAKPMKFDEPEIRTLSLKRIIQYALFLSGYSDPGGRKR